MTNAIQILIFGLMLGGVYALMASGLTLVFGVMRIVNIAHAAIMLIAAYVTYFAFHRLGIDPILSIIITIPLLFVLGVTLYWGLFSWISENERYAELTVLLTFALALVIEGLLGHFFNQYCAFCSTNPSYTSERFLIGPFYIPQGQFYATLLSLGLIGLLWIFLKFTRIGYSIRATMQNPTAAQVVGVNIRQVSAIAFGLGIALAGAAGSILAYLFTFDPGKHWEWIAILLSLIVLGGMGSLVGALVGSFILAVTAAYISNYFGFTWGPITFFFALFVILLLRPQGLFGKKLEAT